MKALSLFSGIGGIDLAAEWAGIKTVAFCEREPFCQKVLAKHWPNTPIYDDVCTLTKERLEADGIGTIELIHGGYPCQPFSLAGDRKGEEDDRHLWPEVFRLLQEIKPKWFVGENVAGHVTLGIDIVLSDLESIGYTWEAFIIPASAVNAPHRRDRVFIVANTASVRQSESRESINTGDSKKSKEGKTINVIDGRIRRAMANADSITGLQTSKAASTIGSEWKPRNDVSGGYGKYMPGTDWWLSEPSVGRVANGIPDRVERLTALGNAVVPHQIYPILAAIKQIDDMEVGTLNN